MMTGSIIPRQNLLYLADRTFYIQMNDDLNNYYTVGTYGVGYNELAQTVANLPVPMAGRLVVVNVSAMDPAIVPGVTKYANWQQWYITITADIYVRTMGSDGNGQLIFGKWKKFASPEVIV